MKILKYKRLAAALSALFLAAGTVSFAAADRGGKVTVIVGVKGDAVLETEAAQEMGVRLFADTDEAADIENSIKIKQAQVENEIKSKIGSSADIGYTYTYVFNGFSAEVYESDIEKIKSLPNVENVYISHTYETDNDYASLDASYLDNGCEMMHADYMHDLGYTGKGMVIAIVDDGFDTNHENFQGAITNPRLSKSDIAEKIKNGNLTINAAGGRATVNRVYRSEKIPYAFNYYTKNSDTVNTLSSHGTHVAGIAAGNNGTDPNGNKFLAAASDAQLLLMANTFLSDETIIASIDDAVKLGADVINASFGGEYVEQSELEQTVVENAVNAGVLFSAAAGNEDRGYNYKAPKAVNIDYGASGVPALHSAATAVASADNTKVWTQNRQLASRNLTMSYFSSWGIGSSLELKPEITAPGGSIYSSVNDDKYQNKSGTSMAAPHMTGASALMGQYIKANTGKYGTVTNIPQLIENLLMTGAEVIMQDTENDIPYSPRKQGSGMINLENSAKTPVVLLGDTYDSDGVTREKSKISLHEMNVDENGKFGLSFRARNLTDTAVTYDSLSMTVITDDAKDDGTVGDMRKLSYTADLPRSVTIPANDEVTINAEVSLDTAELAENTDIFKNGFFIDGFVFLDNTDNTEIPKISIPFTGFYGSWTAAPALDKPMFDENSILNETYMYTVSKRTANGSFANTSDTQIMGTNWFVNSNAEDYKDYCSEDYVGYSPNGDRNADIPSAVVTPLRRLGKNDFAIYDSDGKELLRKTDMADETEYFYCEKFTPTYLYFDDSETNALPDGDYTFKSFVGFYAMQPYEQRESVEMKFYIDREKPVITKFEVSEDGNSLDIAATDNRNLMGIVVSGTKNKEPYTKAYPIKALREYEATIDITGIDEGTLTVEAVDYAQNSTIKSKKGLNIIFSQRSGSNYLFNMSNTTGGQIDCVLTMALYRDGELVGLSSDDKGIPEGESFEVFNVADTAYDTIRVFVWDKFESMMPLYDAFEF